MASQNGRFALLRLSSGFRRPRTIERLGRTDKLRTFGSCRAEFPLATSYATKSSMIPTLKRYHFFSTTSVDSSNKPQVVVQKLGDFPYGSREYRLVVQDSSPPKDSDDDSKSDSDVRVKTLASLRAHRNTLFGAQLMMAGSKKKRSLTEVCAPLLDIALEEAGVEGEQPQAMATLHGLCDWVVKCLEEDDNNESNGTGSKALRQIKTEYQDDLLAYHAIRAIATGIPREGHSVVGQGTFRDGERGWEALAKEFIELNLAEEVELYLSRGATVVEIEHLADTKPAYLSSAGGAMARLFFL